MAESYVDLFRERFKLDCLRQPSQRAEMDRLRNDLHAQGYRHPYRMTFAARNHLAGTITSFGWSHSKWPARPASTILYRICNIGALRHQTDWLDLVDEEWMISQLEAKAHGGWVALSLLATGVLGNYRGFTWWTSRDLSQGDACDNWRSLGMLDAWVGTAPVLLRCRLADVHDDLVVPTTVDGFEGPVFEAVDESPTPAIGRAIDLGVRPLRVREEECLLKEVPVTKIAIKLLTIDGRRHPRPERARAGATLWADLTEYYRRCQR